jgi:uncharacterized protein (DUF2249 family)
MDMNTRDKRKPEKRHENFLRILHRRKDGNSIQIASGHTYHTIINLQEKE